MDQAAAAGHLDIVQWLREHRREGCTTKAMDRAAKNGLSHAHKPTLSALVFVGWLPASSAWVFACARILAAAVWRPYGDE
ncbi:hypothetical protein PybrP1_006986 [[Pythium] brassicae (nom. inval.)]|nr:hypothetical protein PybrP1_006986 [[Pythium] brassicae (nom. inval.)]